MFKFLSRTQSTDTSKPADWPKSKTFKNIQRAIDGSISSISEYIVERVNVASYDSELKAIQREVLSNERTINRNAPTNSRSEFNELKQTLMDHREYQQKMYRESNPQSNSNQPLPRKAPDIKKLNNEDRLSKN